MNLRSVTFPVTSPTAISKRCGGSSIRAGSPGANGFHGWTFSPFTVMTRSRSACAFEEAVEDDAKVLGCLDRQPVQAAPAPAAMRAASPAAPGPASARPPQCRANRRAARARAARRDPAAGSTTSHSSHSAIRSRSSVRAAIRLALAELRVTTVTERHCDSEAVFSPSPYRPRSPRA